MKNRIAKKLLRVGAFFLMNLLAACFIISFNKDGDAAPFGVVKKTRQNMGRYIALTDSIKSTTLKQRNILAPALSFSHPGKSNSPMTGNNFALHAVVLSEQIIPIGIIGKDDSLLALLHDWFFKDPANDSTPIADSAINSKAIQ